MTSLGLFKFTKSDICDGVVSGNAFDNTIDASVQNYFNSRLYSPDYVNIYNDCIANLNGRICIPGKFSLDLAGCTTWVYPSGSVTRQDAFWPSGSTLSTYEIDVYFLRHDSGFVELRVINSARYTGTDLLTDFNVQVGDNIYYNN